MESIFRKKTKIEINMRYLNESISDLVFLGLIFGGRGLEKHESYYYIGDYYDADTTNILSLNVLNLFENLQTSGYTKRYYPFSLYR